MNAANITHALKVVGGNTRMWVGVLVIAVFFAIAINLLAQDNNRRQIAHGLFD